MDLIHALNEEDFDSARNCITEDFSFVGVMGTRKGAESYIEDMKKIKIKYKILKVLAEGCDVCVLCDYTMDGKTIFGCSWYELRDGQLSSLRQPARTRLASLSRMCGVKFFSMAQMRSAALKSWRVAKDWPAVMGGMVLAVASEPCLWRAVL